MRETGKNFAQSLVSYSFFQFTRSIQTAFLGKCFEVQLHALCQKGIPLVGLMAQNGSVEHIPLPHQKHFFLCGVDALGAD